VLWLLRPEGVSLGRISPVPGGYGVGSVGIHQPLSPFIRTGFLPHEEIDLPLFMMNGDLLTSLNINSFLEFHNNHISVATMCGSMIIRAPMEWSLAPSVSLVVQLAI